MAALLSSSSGYQTQLDTAAKLALYRGDWARQKVSRSSKRSNGRDQRPPVYRGGASGPWRAAHRERRATRGHQIFESLELPQEILTSTAPILAWASRGWEPKRGLELTSDVSTDAATSPALTEALRIQAKALIADGTPSSKRRGSVKEALELSRKIGYPFARGWLLVERSRCRRGSGDIDAANSDLQQRLNIFNRLPPRKKQASTQMLEEPHITAQHQNVILSAE